MKKIYFLLLVIVLSYYVCMDLEEDLVGVFMEELFVEGNGINYDCVCGGLLIWVYFGLRYFGIVYYGGYFFLQEFIFDEMVVCVKGSDWYDGGI